jgi:hypothetical protein
MIRLRNVVNQQGRAGVTQLDKPPALPGDSQSVTVAGLCFSPGPLKGYGRHVKSSAALSFRVCDEAL